MMHNFAPGDRVTWHRGLGRKAEGIVVQRGVENRKRYVVVSFHKPMKFKKKFEDDEIKALRSSRS